MGKPDIWQWPKYGGGVYRKSLNCTLGAHHFADQSEYVMRRPIDAESTLIWLGVSVGSQVIVQDSNNFKPLTEGRIFLQAPHW